MEIFNRLKHGLVVSCQAEGDSPFNSPEGVALMAEAAVQGGAAGIRTEGKEKTAEIIRRINLPVVGLMTIGIRGWICQNHRQLSGFRSPS